MSVCLSRPSSAQVEFPNKPATSAEAKEFMRRCLAARQAERWDVLTAAQAGCLFRHGLEG